MSRFALAFFFVFTTRSWAFIVACRSPVGKRVEPIRAHPRRRGGLLSVVSLVADFLFFCFFFFGTIGKCFSSENWAGAAHSVPSHLYCTSTC